jgi:chromosome segregation ATPase
MAILKTLGTIAILLSSFWVAGCQTTSAGDKERQAADTAAASAHADEIQAADAAKKALKARLDEVQHSLDALKTDARPASAKVRHELDKQVKTLQDQVAELRSKLSSEQGRAEEWNQMKQNTEDAIQKIEGKVNELTQPKK